MIEYKIETGIPIPERKKSGLQAALESMNVNDSVLITGRSRGSVSASMIHAKKTTGFTFTARAVEGGVRIWRIK